MIARALLAEAPVDFVAYDLLEGDGVDRRDQPLWQRREQLQALAMRCPGLRLSPLVAAEDWSALAAQRASARERGVEGLMLKRIASTYQVGRRRGDWWKWKVDPLRVTFAVQAFRDHPATTDARLTLAARFADATSRRIEFHLEYALSQQNNHGISEVIGLQTAATFWPSLSGSPYWYHAAVKALAKQCAELIGPDGGFSQHSTNYHRLLLQLLAWSEVVERSAGGTLPEPVRAQALAATDFLATLMESDGTVPRYGCDDGANLLPLSGCPFEDFRPSVGAALALFKGERLPAGPWDETSLLLLGPISASADPALRPPAEFRDAGVFQLRHPRGTLFFRAPEEFRTRPSHADQLHVSLRWDGEWLTEDPGTYSYNAPGGWDGFAGSRFHNVVTVGEFPADRPSQRAQAEPEKLLPATLAIPALLVMSRRK